MTDVTTELFVQLKQSAREAMPDAGGVGLVPGGIEEALHHRLVANRAGLCRCGRPRAQHPSGVSDHYTQAGTSGERHILLCRVLVCRVRIGDQSMLSKPDDCDTTVNSDLEIFCKFDNREKYEEYVISYR